jgi:hypothetical protein
MTDSHDQPGPLCSTFGYSRRTERWVNIFHWYLYVFGLSVFTHQTVDCIFIDMLMEA